MIHASSSDLERRRVALSSPSSLTRGGSDARRDLIVRPASYDRLVLSVIRHARIRRMSFRTVLWDPSWCAVTLVSMAAQVSSEIQACLNRSLRVGLGIWVLISKKSLSGANKRSQRRVRRVKRRALRRYPVRSFAGSSFR